MARETGGPTWSKPEKPRRQWLPWLAGILMVAFLVSLVPVGTALLASGMLANASPPAGVEFPATPAALLASGSETTALAGQGRGLNCSIPWIVEKLAFGHGGGLSNPSARYRQACVAHDMCYRHGAATYGYTQADCDQMLMRAAFRLCKKTAELERAAGDGAPAAREGRPDEDNPVEDKIYQRCVDEARMVFFGVFLGGSTAFRPVETRQDGRVALLEGSGPAEYDSYPAGGASYSVGRLIEGPATSLVLFRRSPGGGKYIRRDWTGAAFSHAVTGALPARWEDQPTQPFVMLRSDGRPDTLVWWWRRSGRSFPTYGTFAGATATAFAGGPALDAPFAPRTLDPGASQFYPVPGRSPDGLMHLIGVTDFSGDWDQCGTGAKSIQIVHVTLDAGVAGRSPSYRCVIHQITRSVHGPAQPEHLGSYLGEPPTLSFDGNGIRVTLFRRDGEKSPSDYSDVLSGLTVRIPLREDGDSRPKPTRRCWRLAESEEPFFAPAGSDGLLATLTFSGPDGAVDPDEQRDARLFLRTVGPGASGSNCAGVAETWRLPVVARSYLKARTIHIRMGAGSGMRLSGSTDALVMTRVIEARGRLQASAFVIAMKAGRVVACTRSVFDLPETLVNTASEASRRAAALQPIVGDLDRNGSPDLVLADTRGGTSFGFLGLDGGGGRFGFAPSGSRTAQVARADCEHIH